MKSVYWGNPLHCLEIAMPHHGGMKFYVDRVVKVREEYEDTPLAGAHWMLCMIAIESGLPSTEAMMYIERANRVMVEAHRRCKFEEGADREQLTLDAARDIYAVMVEIFERFEDPDVRKSIVLKTIKRMKDQTGVVIDPPGIVACKKLISDMRMEDLTPEQSRELCMDLIQLDMWQNQQYQMPDFEMNDQFYFQFIKRINEMRKKFGI